MSLVTSSYPVQRPLRNHCHPMAICQVKTVCLHPPFSGLCLRCLHYRRNPSVHVCQRSLLPIVTSTFLQVYRYTCDGSSPQSNRDFKAEYMQISQHRHRGNSTPVLCWITVAICHWETALLTLPIYGQGEERPSRYHPTAAMDRLRRRHLGSVFSSTTSSVSRLLLHNLHMAMRR